MLESYHVQLDVAIDTYHTNVDQLINIEKNAGNDSINWQDIKDEANRLVIDNSRRDLDNSGISLNRGISDNRPVPEI